MKRLVVVLTVAALSGCGDDASGPVAVYDVPASGALKWGQAPFPNDLFLSADGTVDIAALASTNPLWESVRATLPQRHGFCGTCAIHFPITGAIDPATLAGNVTLIDEAGTKIPIDVEWDPKASVVALRAQRGHVLDGGKRYSAGITDGVHGTDGSPLRAASGFTSARAKTVTTGAITALQAAGVSGKIVSATTFTVEDPTWLAKDLEQRVTAYFAAHGAPTVTVTRVYKASDGTLTDLMGTPAQNLPGLDNPAMSGTAGKFGITHETTAIVIKGTYQSARVITGTGKELGTLAADTTAGDAVPFMLAIPTGVDVTHLPVVVFANGAGGMLWQALALADVAGHAHCALLAFENFQHGERSTTAVDAEHALRGDSSLGPDGFYEHQTTTVGLRIFAVDGVPAEQHGSPMIVLGTLAQMAADLESLIAMVKTSDLSAIQGADASLAGLAFDPDRVYFVGVSLGTVYGALALAADTTVSAGVFNVALGSLTECVLENELFRTQFELALLAPLDVPNDTYEPDRHLMMQPSIAMFDWVLSPTEPDALAHANASRPGRDLLWQIAGLDEYAGTPSGEGLVAITGVPAIGDYSHATVVPGTAPLSHLGAAKFAIADHFLIVNQAGVSKDEPPGLPPFVPRSTPLMFTNPIVDASAQLTHFFETRRTTGTAEIQ